MSKSSTKATQTGQQSQTANATQNLQQNSQQNIAQMMSQMGLENGATSQTDTGSNNQTQAGTSSSSTAANNLASLQQGWLAGANLLGATNDNSADLVNQGLSLTGAGSQAASDSAIRALNSIQGLFDSGAANGANQYLTPFANGSMNGNNPQFQNTVDLIARSIQPQIDGQFAAGGRYGSGANANAFASALTNKVGDLAYQNYGDTLNRQLQAGGQLSSNNTNSTNAALAALGLIPNLGSTAAGAGGAAINAGQSPLSAYAQLMAQLGSGGGTTTGATNNTAAGTTNNTANGTSSNTSQQNGLNFGSTAGSGAQTGNVSSSMSGNMNGTSNSSSSGINLGDLFKMFSFSF